MRLSRQLLKLLEDEREAHRQERRELLNRIAQPNVPIAKESEEVRESRVSQDNVELAFIGQEVPDGVAVGVEREST